MSVDRRQLLRGSLAAGAAAAVPFSVPLASAHAAARGERAAPAFQLALCDANNKVIENYSTGDIVTDAQGGSSFGAPTSVFHTGGWAPLECKFRTLKSGEEVFMVCGGDETKGRVTIHRTSDSAPLGWDTDIPIFPHSLEYLPTADAVIVVGTRGLDDEDPPPPQLPGGPKPRPGGSFQLYTAPTEAGPGSFTKIGDAHAFRQAHGVVRDQNQQDLVWIFGGNKLLAYRVKGERESTWLDYEEEHSLTDQEDFENAHDLQPDPVDTQFLWATGSKHLLKINKSAGRPRVEWRQAPAKAKSFSRHRSGRGMYTFDAWGNAYGYNKVHFLWPYQEVTVPKTGKQGDRWIYKARLTDI